MEETETNQNVTDYSAYTTKFDREVPADELSSILGTLIPDDEAALDEAWHSLKNELLGWSTKVHIRASEIDSRIRKEQSEELLSDTAVTLLIDQSGSMRGQKMLFTAATVDIVQEFLLTLGITCEVLGFTTSEWCGGRSRKRWNWRFRPNNPGRLNDLLHIIYKSADDRRASTGGWHFRQMLRPDLPKENIDGEAILWASDRLLELPASRKHLVILSDGAPVDDSTLAENHSSYLSDHLRFVIENLMADGKIKVSAMGIGYRVHEYYKASSYIEAPAELGKEVLLLLEKVLLEQP